MLEIGKLNFTNILSRDWVVLASISTSIFFVLISVVLVLGNYQSQNGDFGQYFIHAQNLLKDRPWGYSVEGYPAVLPLYPYLIAAITFFFDANVYYYAIANSIMWAITCLAWVSIFKEKYNSKSISLLYLVFILFLPFVMSFQQEALPNIMFAMSCALSFRMVIFNDGQRLSFLAVFLILLPALIRIESIALFCAYIAYFSLNRKYLLCFISAFGIALTVGVDLFIGIGLEMKSNFLVLSDFNKTNVKRSDDQFMGTLIAIAHLGSSYLLGFAEMFVPAKLSEASKFSIEFSKTRVLSTSYFNFVVLLIFLMGYFKRGKIFDLDSMFLVALLGLVSLFPLPEAPIRYLLPIFPVFAFYFILALTSSAQSIVNKNSASTFFVFLLLLPIYYFSLKVAMNEPQRRNFLFNKYATEMADWVSENRNGRGIGFFKPRLMTVLMDMRDQNNAADYNLRNVQMAENLIKQKHLLVVMNGGGYGQVEIMAYLKGTDQASVVWENRSFTAFEASQ